MVGAGDGEAPDTADAEATFVVGARGFIEDADDAACLLLGYDRDALVGLHGADLVPEDRQAATAVSVDRMRRGELTAREGSLRCRDGSVIRVDVRARQLPDGRLALAVRRRRTA